MTSKSLLVNLMLLSDIIDSVVNSSTILDSRMKEAFKSHTRFVRDLVMRDTRMTSRGLHQLTSELLTYWNESVNPDTEKIWTSIRANGLDYERKEPLRFALEKKRFKRVDQGMDARKHWN